MNTHDLVRKYLYDCIYSSCKVEGLNITFPQVQQILDDAPIDAGVRTSDIHFVLNMRNAWEFLMENSEEKISLAIIREYNKICGRDLIQGCGELRQCRSVLRR